jgi:hypothetical protein
MKSYYQYNDSYGFAESRQFPDQQTHLWLSKKSLFHGVNGRDHLLYLEIITDIRTVGTGKELAYTGCSESRLIELTHTYHKDTERSTLEAPITLDGVTLTDSLIR